MSAKDLVDGIRRAFPVTLPMARHRDLVSRLVFGRPFSAAIAAERDAKLEPPSVHDADISRLGLEYGLDLAPLAAAARALLQGDRSAMHEAYITTYWRDPKGTGPRRAGRSTVRVELARPLTDLLKRHEVARARNLEYFRLEAVDHLERVTDLLGGKAEAERALLAAVRTLRFLEVTGLRPATRPADRVLGDDRMPGQDHQSYWIDPPTGQKVMLDEPYPHVDMVARAAWLERHGLSLASSPWDGLYNPGRTKPFLICTDLDVLRKVVAALAPLAEPRPLTWEIGGTGSYTDRFVSPARQAEGKSARRRTMPASPGATHKGAIAFGGRPGEKGRWRPEEPMPLEQHVKAGTLLQSMDTDGIPWRAYQHIRRVTSDLETWSNQEHGDACEANPNIYYGARLPEHLVAPREGLVELKQILEAGYAECAPRRKMIDRLDLAISMLDAQRMKILKNPAGLQRAGRARHGRRTGASVS